MNIRNFFGGFVEVAIAKATRGETAEQIASRISPSSRVPRAPAPASPGSASPPG